MDSDERMATKMTIFSNLYKAGLAGFSFYSDYDSGHYHVRRSVRIDGRLRYEMALAKKEVHNGR